MDIFVFVHSKNTKGLFSKKNGIGKQKKNIVPAKMFELPPSITFTNFLKKKKKKRKEKLESKISESIP